MVQPLAIWTDAERVAAALEAAGMRPSVARDKSALFLQAARHLIDSGTLPELGSAAWWVPGRIEVLGKHTDYAGGRSLTAATERGFAIVAVTCQERVLTVHAAQSGESDRFALFAESRGAAQGWRLYASTLASRLAADLPGLQWGADAAFASDLPQDAGLSSSSALLVALFQTVAGANDLFQISEFGASVKSVEDLASYLSCVENGSAYPGLSKSAVEGVGTRGGSEDHVAILCSRQGELGLFRYRPVERIGSIPLPAGWTFAIAGSGVAAHKAGAARDAYNRAADLAAEIAGRCGRSSLDEAVRSLGEAGVREAVGRDPELQDRLSHFLFEDGEAVAGGATALADGRVAEFGDWVDRSQEAGVRLLGNQVPETIALARIAKEAGAACASAFGAGFGGSVYALVREGAAEAFLTTWRERYAAEHPEAAERGAFFLTHPGPPTVPLKP